VAGGAGVDDGAGGVAGEGEAWIGVGGVAGGGAGAAGEGGKRVLVKYVTTSAASVGER